MEVRGINNPDGVSSAAQPLQGSTTKVMKKQSSKNSQQKRSEFTSAAQKKAREGAREANRDSKKASRVVPVRVGPKSTKGVVKRVGGLLHPESDLALWSEMLSHPFAFEGRFCPVSYNPAPSFIQSTARTTVTNMNLSVAAGTTTQMVLFPGHSRQISDATIGLTGGTSMDAVSYHANDVLTSTGTCVIGPMDKTDNVATRTSAIGLLRPGLGLGTTANATAAMSPLTWDVSLPYVAQGSTSGHHSRWQLAAMGLRIRQTTPELSRGGNVITVQPNNSLALANVVSLGTLEVYPTFYDHGTAEKAEIAWIPRAQDLSFWHGAENITAGSPESLVIGPGILVFFNNPTGADLSFSYEIVCHWQLAGSYLNPVGGPAPHAPETKPAIEKVVSTLQNGHSTASPARQLFEKAVAHSGIASPGTWAAAAQRVGGRLGKMALGAAGFAAAA